jgi:hypothetical protein
MMPGTTQLREVPWPNRPVSLLVARVVRSGLNGTEAAASVWLMSGKPTPF